MTTKNKFLIALAVVVLLGAVFKSSISQYAFQYIGKQRMADGQEKFAKAQEEWAYTLAMQAYIYAYPSVNINRYRHKILASDDATNDAAGINRWAHERQRVTHEFAAGGSPNNDTLTSWGLFDLREEPVILEVPNMNGRYYSIQILDNYINNFAYIGRRTTGTKAGVYALVAPNWQGQLPEGVVRIDAPTPDVSAAIRILIDSKEEQPLINALQDRFTTRPLSEYGDPDFSYPAERPNLRPMPDPNVPFDVWAVINREMTLNPPPARDKGLMNQFAQIGIGQNQLQTFNHLSAPVRAGLVRALNEGPGLLEAYGNGALIEKNINGWGFAPSVIGTYGENFILRAGVSRIGVAANSPEEGLYMILHSDISGDLLDGHNIYQITFAAGQQPPSDAFWSLTVYQHSNNGLVANEINRYSVGDRTPGIQYSEDGSLTIYIQSDNPGADKVSNWLPVPKGPFYMLGRSYQAKPELLKGEWVPPALEKR